MASNPSMRFTEGTLRALSRAVAEIYRPVAPSHFPAQVVRALEAVFGSDIVTYNELPVDGSAPLIVSNNGFEKETGRLLQECAPHLMQNPLVAKMMTEGKLAPMRISDVMPFKDYQQTAIYNEWYRPLDGDYQMACAFPAEERDRLLAMAVNQKRREFGDGDLFLFGLLASHVQQAYQISRSLERATREAEMVKAAVDSSGSGIILFDDRFRVVMASAAAMQLMRSFPGDGVLLPEVVRRYAMQVMGRLGSEVPVQRAPLHLVLDDGGRLTLRLSVDPERRRHCLMIETEPGIFAVEDCLALGLTPREGEVLRWTLQGKTSWETGTILGISARTVEKHLQNVYDKLGVNERRQLSDRIDELRTRASGGQPS